MADTQRKTHVLRELGDYRYDIVEMKSADTSFLQTDKSTLKSNKNELNKMSYYIEKTYLLHEQVLEDQISFQSLSLSSYIYKCLCDSDSFSEPNSEVVTGMQGFSR